MREGTAVGAGQGAWQDNQRGPSWADAFYLAHQLEAEFNVQIHFRLLAEDGTNRWTRSLCRVVAIALRVRERPEDSIRGSALYGYSAGARSMPAAIVAALYELEERITDPLAHWQPPAFPLS